MNFDNFNKSRNKQLKQSQNNKKTFDINQYNTEDLLGILNLTLDAPINKDKIDEKIKTLKYELRNNKKKDKIFPFLEIAAKKLKENFDEFNKPTWKNAYEHDESEATDVLKNQYQDNKDPEKNLILNEQSNIIGRIKQTIQDKMAIQGTVQGDKNPIQRKTIKKIINFDSQYREILDPQGTDCNDDEEKTNEETQNSQIRLYTSTNYTNTLSEPSLNVVDITVDNVEIPYSWYVFTEDYGTNRFQIDISGTQGPTNIYIPEGNHPSASSLINEINTQLASKVPASDISFNLDTYSDKVTISVKPDYSVTFNWYIEDQIGSQCTAPSRKDNKSLLEPPKPGNKINYNLGWLLGFRTQKTVVDGNKKYNVYDLQYPTSALAGKYKASSIVDVYGTKYLLIALDDYNNNKPNTDLISLTNNSSNNFKLPEYFKPLSMNTSIFDDGTGDNSGNKYQKGHPNDPNYLCVDIAGPPSARGCAENEINKDLISNLTKKQKFSVDQMLFANSSERKTRYTSPNSSDILIRIPVNNPPNNTNKIISFKNEKSEETKRVYFGPVTLRKFNIRLLNDKGYEVNLHDRDWSFSIIINKLYQY